MKRILPLFLSLAFALCMSAAVFAQGVTAHEHGNQAAGSDSAKAESPAEEKKETPAQEKAEEKSERKHKAPKVKMAPVDLNNASKEDLTKVPGLTDDLADKIIAGRPYTSKGQLVSKKVLTKEEYKMIKSHVMAKKEKTAK
ncbi:MAG TPA: helix-hairpin-helix domain-containing protein [Candidatus Eisenbacteria bacterium]|nr:helix-hairpin-helix domain-containing protein [Candidatus Eisenbacteria bacterium]